MIISDNHNLSLALGFFDGVHLGHQAVIDSAVSHGHKSGGKSAVVTFKDHPCCFLYEVCPKYILTREDRVRKIKELGVDEVIELDFSQIAHLSAQEYLEFLVKEFNPVSISTGYNHTFGKCKSGNAQFLLENSEKYDYTYFEISPVNINGHVISSTEIRTALSNGDIKKANKMLGYNFFIEGKVIGGKKLGRELGFPTANLIYPGELIDLPFGVYKVKANGLKAIANFGTKPTVTEGAALLEVHILDFNQDIYGQNITVEFLKFLRPEEKFTSVEALKAQIEKDIKML